MKARSQTFYAAIWLPRFALQAALRNHQRSGCPSAKAALAVLDGEEDLTAAQEAGTGRILHANSVAEKQGVFAGMTAPQAMARCMKLTLLRRVAAVEEQLQQELLQCADHWTPHYESTAPGLCVLDVSAIRNVWQNRLSCCEGIHAELTARKLEVTVGFAEDPDHASLAAHAADKILILDGGRNEASLNKLPVRVLQPSAAVLEVLQLWGVHTLAQLAALPRAGVAERLGAEGLHVWQLARGGAGRLLQRVRTVTLFCETLELEHGVESLEPLLGLLQRMLQGLCARLAEHWLVVAAENLVLKFEDGSVHERLLRVAEPTRDEELLLRVLRAHLDGLRAPSAVRVVTLDLKPTRQAMRQNLLFERGLRDPQRFAETLTQLEALFGIGRVGKPRLLPTRRPDAFSMAAFLEPLPAATPGGEGPAYGLPFSCFRPPRLVSVRLQQHRPVAMTTAEATLDITQANGPCLLSGDWWDRQAWSREVWVVEVSDGSLYRLACEGRQWMLDGVFG
ncbi:Y-family DNA polymerase [Prosthecobacter sp.]|uniref:Y-family DNA polymerase n=1 Tax=Prosthecobacter sp. TaxID=1965333 RepID=UPI003784570A